MAGSNGSPRLDARAHILFVPIAAVAIVLSTFGVALARPDHHVVVDEAAIRPVIAHLDAPSGPPEPHPGWAAWHQREEARAAWFRGVHDAQVRRQAEAAAAAAARARAEAAAAQERARSVPAPAKVTFTGSIPDLIRRIFGPAGEAAIRVANCESSLNPGAVSPGGGNHGLFQINNVHAGQFAAVTGRPWATGRYEAYANTVFAHWLYDRSGWGPWGCSWAA